MTNIVIKDILNIICNIFLNKIVKIIKVTLYEVSLNRQQKVSYVGFFLIPLRICPFLTIVKTANQILCGLTSSAELLLTAKFIDTALAVFNGQAQLKEIYLPLILIGLLVAYQLLNWSAIRLILEKMEMRLNREYRSAIVEKRAKLEYCHIENNDTWDLISRTCDQSVQQIMNGFDNLLSMAQLLVNMGSMMLIVMTQVWWIGLLIIAVSVPLFAVAIKGGKETYKANKEAQKYTRRSDYLREGCRGENMWRNVLCLDIPTG